MATTTPRPPIVIPKTLADALAFAGLSELPLPGLEHEIRRFYADDDVTRLDAFPASAAEPYYLVAWDAVDGELGMTCDLEEAIRCLANYARRKRR